MSFEQTVLHFASPALCGIKPACLFSMGRPAFESSYTKFALWKEDFQALGKHIAVIHRTKDLLLFFIYDHALLAQTVGRRAAAQYLAAKGYPVRSGLDAILMELCSRLACPRGFPHEIGLFLGYPLADVRAFEADAGVNSKYTGFWQVYGNVAEACKKMQEYRQCSHTCCKLLEQGLTASDICKNYRSFLKSHTYKEAC